MIRQHAVAATLHVAGSEGVFVSELLCFALFAVSKIAIKSVRNIICDFYNADQISEAKEVLCNDIDTFGKNDASFAELTRPPKRRAGENKAKLEVEDIVSLVESIDDKGLTAKLPKYTAGNLMMVPSIKAEKGDILMLLNKLMPLNTSCVISGN